MGFISGIKKVYRREEKTDERRIARQAEWLGNKAERIKNKINIVRSPVPKSTVKGYNKYRTHIKEGYRGGYGSGLFHTNRSNLNKLLR